MSHRLIQRLITVGDEFEAALSALVLATGRWSILHLWDEVAGLRLASFQLAERNVEATYVVRLFAEFEAILRAQYPHSRPGRPVPRRSYNLIVNLGSRYAIPAQIMAEVHQIREFRHSIAHADPGTSPVSFTDALSWLNRYLACIPDPEVPG